MKKNEILLITLLSLFILISCDDSASPMPGAENNYLPLKVGNYWIYNSFKKDMNNNIMYNTLAEDSVVIEWSENIMGVKAFFFVRYREGELLDTMTFANHKHFVYRLYDSTGTYVPSLEKTWFPIVDWDVQHKGQWNVFKKLFENYPYAYWDSIYYGEFRHTVNGEYEYIDSIDIFGMKYLSKKYSNKYDSKYEVSMITKVNEQGGSYYYDTLHLTRLLKYYDKYQLAEGVGFFKIQKDSYIINTLTEPSSTLSNVIEVNGEESLLNRYKLVK
ncbi:hypothetical protein ACFLSQ_06355 [Bacteroidota bacterium]